MLAHLKPLKERDFLLGNIATHYAVSRKNSSLHFFGNKSSTYKFRSRLSSYAFWRFYIWCGLLSVTRFPQQCSCNIPSERTRIGHTGADLCHRPPQGINHSLRSFSAIKVSVFEKKIAKTAFKPGLVASFRGGKTKVENSQNKFLGRESMKIEV